MFHYKLAKEGGLMLPVISVSIMALHRQNTELDHDIVRACLHAVG